MKNFLNNLKKPNLGFLLPAIIFIISYYFTEQITYLVLSICFVALAFIPDQNHD